MTDRLTLREARDQAGKSREKVARELGISAKTLERWEDPERRPGRIDRDILLELARIYGVPVKRIVFSGREAA